MTIDKIKNLMTNTFRGVIIEDTDEKIIFELREQWKIDLDKEYFTTINQRLTSELTTNETELFNDKSFEILAKENSRFYPLSRHRESNVSDTVNGFEYSFGQPSDEYILLLLEQMQASDDRTSRRHLDPTRYWRIGSRRTEPEQPELFNPTLFDVFRVSLSGVQTVKITSKNYKSKCSEKEQI